MASYTASSSSSTDSVQQGQQSQTVPETKRTSKDPKDQQDPKDPDESKDPGKRKSLYGIRTVPVKQVPIKPPPEKKGGGDGGGGGNDESGDAVQTIDAYTYRLLTTVNEGYRRGGYAQAQPPQMMAPYAFQPSYRDYFGL